MWGYWVYEVETGSMMSFLDADGGRSTAFISTHEGNNR